MPVDAKPVRDGNVIMMRSHNSDELKVVVLARDAEVIGRNRYTSHFATCPNAKAHRKEKRRSA